MVRRKKIRKKSAKGK